MTQAQIQAFRFVMHKVLAEAHIAGRNYYQLRTTIYFDTQSEAYYQIAIEANHYRTAADTENFGQWIQLS